MELNLKLIQILKIIPYIMNKFLYIKQKYICQYNIIFLKFIESYAIADSYNR